MPMTASSRRRVRDFTNPIARAASTPLRNAPTANGTPARNDRDTPGTMACARASPIRDHPLSVMKQESSAHTPPMTALTTMAFTMYS